MANRFPRFWWTRAIPIGFSLPCLGIPMVRMWSAESSDPPMAARAGKRFSIRMRTPARWILEFDPGNPANRLRGAVGGAAGALGERGMERPWKRTFQIHRWRKHVAATDGRAASLRLKDSGESASGLRPAIRIACTRWWKGSRARCIAPMMREQLETREHGRARFWAWFRFRLRARGSKKQRRHLYREHVNLQVFRCGANFHGDQGRARRRRLSHYLDQSRSIRKLFCWPRSRRHHHGEWRRNMEFLVQPADRAVLPCDHRQPVPVLGLWRATGERLGGSCQPQRLRRDHVSGMASGGRGRVRICGARSAESQHYLWRQGDALRSEHRASAASRAGGARRQAASIDLCAPCRCCFRR